MYLHRKIAESTSNDNYLSKKECLSEDKPTILLSNYKYRLAYHSNKNITASNYRLMNNIVQYINLIHNENDSTYLWFEISI